MYLNPPDLFWRLVFSGLSIPPGDLSSARVSRAMLYETSFEIRRVGLWNKGCGTKVVEPKANHLERSWSATGIYVYIGCIPLVSLLLSFSDVR